MAGNRQSRISEMINPPSSQPSPGPGPAPSAPPPPAPPPPPAEWPVPSAPASAGGKGILYTESAMEWFAGTSEDRATAFRQIHAKAHQAQVSAGAFGIMFGRLVYSAYEQHSRSVRDGIASAADAMTDIADGVRDSAKSIRDVETATAQAAARAVRPAG